MYHARWVPRLTKNIHVEIVLVGFHPVQASHQTSIVAIETSAEVGTSENKVEAEHALGPRRILCVVDIMGQLDSDVGFWEGIVVGAHGLFLVDAACHVGWVVWRYADKDQVIGDTSSRWEAERSSCPFISRRQSSYEFGRRIWPDGQGSVQAPWSGAVLHADVAFASVGTSVSSHAEEEHGGCDCQGCNNQD